MRFCILFFLFLFTNQFTAQESVLKTDSAVIDFVSEAPLEFITARSEECSGIINCETNAFAFRVKIRSFEGFNSPLQKEHFNENYLESEDIPYATFTGKILDQIDYSTTGIHKVSTKGILNIHNVEDERVIDLELKINNDGTIDFSSKFEIELVTHDIDVPRIVYQKISEIIEITVKGILF